MAGGIEGGLGPCSLQEAQREAQPRGGVGRGKGEPGDRCGGVQADAHSEPAIAEQFSLCHCHSTPN